MFFVYHNMVNKLLSTWPLHYSRLVYVGVMQAMWCSGSR